MKKTQKIVGMIAGGFAIAGILMIIAGALMGGIQVVSSDVRAGRLSISPNTGIYIDIFTDSDFDKMTSIEEKSVFDSSEVTNVIFEAEHGEFQIETWENAYYEIKSINQKDNQRIRYSLEDGTLSICIKGKKFVVFEDDVKAILYVPRDTTVDKFKMSIGAGELNCYNITNIEQLFINIGAGEGTFNGIAAEYVEMNVGAGDGNVENAIFGSTNFNVGVGDLDVYASITGDVNIDCGVGDMDVELAGEYSDYNYKITVGLGEVSIGEQKYSGAVETTEIDNKQDKDVDVRCGVGDVSVEFNKKNIY